MKPIIVSFLLFVPFVLGARYYFVCQTLQWCARESLAAPAISEVAVELPDGTARTLHLPTYASGAADFPRTAISLQLIDTLTALLQRYDERLVVDAPFQASEPRVEQGHYRNLGLARAANLAQALQRRGIPGERIELLSHPAAAGEDLALRLGFEEAGPAFTLDAALATGVLPDSIALHGLRFETNSTALSPNEALNEYALQLVDALQLDTTRQLTLIGHTDSRADKVFNDSLGRWRAEAVARYLQQLGYTRPITTESQGERQPLATNATADGRYLNRRVEVRID